METLGLLIFASLFLLSGYKHIKNHTDMAAYTELTMGSCPVAKQLGYLGGWPTGLFLVVFGVGVAFNWVSLFAYGLAAFLVLVTALFHRNFLQDPAGLKGVALAGAALFIATHTR